MGQRSGPHGTGIPSLLEYKTIQLRDRYATPPSTVLVHSDVHSGTQQAENGQNVDVISKHPSAESPHPGLPPSLASYGGLHSFSQMAQFLPDYSAKRLKGRPLLEPLSQAGFGTDAVTAESLVKASLSPFLRNVVPEGYLSAKSNLLQSSLQRAPSNVDGPSQSFTAGPVAEIEDTPPMYRKEEAKSDRHQSEPILHANSKRVPPISRTQCTVHSDTCNCVHSKQANSQTSRPEKQGRTKSVPGSIATAKKLPRISAISTVKTSMADKGPKRSIQRSKLCTSKPKMITRPVKVVSQITSDRIATEEKSLAPVTDTRDDEREDGSPPPSMLECHFSQPKPLQLNVVFADTSSTIVADDEDELLYFHRLTSILHPPPNRLPPLARDDSEARPSLGSTLADRLSARSDDCNLQGWAQDGFLEDSALRRAVLLRNQALHSTHNVTAHVNPLAAKTETPIDAKSVGSEVIEKDTANSEPGDKKSSEPGMKNSASTSVKQPRGKTIINPQPIKSMTWQEVSPHLGPKKGSSRNEAKTLKKRADKLLAAQKKRTDQIVESLKLLQKKQPQHTEHTNCASTAPEAHPANLGNVQMCIASLPPVTLFSTHDLSISCRAKTSKSLTSLTGKDPHTGSGATNTQKVLVFSSSYPRFITMHSMPFYKSHEKREPSGKTMKEKNFAGQIDGTKVKRREQSDVKLSARVKSPRAPSK
ncbi:uncharacterized protein [Diadema setosum]|uniref:uncharacterized protein n=1 Tax=Diadema setosum TaxID=31175 RepID=UPI003B3A3543